MATVENSHTIDTHKNSCACLIAKLVYRHRFESDYTAFTVPDVQLKILDNMSLPCTSSVFHTPFDVQKSDPQTSFFMFKSVQVNKMSYTNLILNHTIQSV